MHVNNLIENQSALLIANVNWQCCVLCLPVNDSSTSQGGKNRIRELITEGIKGRHKFWRISSYFSISRLPTIQLPAAADKDSIPIACFNLKLR